MAYIAPDTIVKIMKNVPLDNTYDHTVWFASKVAQETYFSGSGVVKYTLSKQSYQRTYKNKIRVEVTADNLYDCNYMAFQNTAYGNKWFYAFITEVEYVNNVTSEITYEIDVMQTYRFDIIIGECFVEREHVTDDTVGANTIAEPIDCPECEVIQTKELYFNRWRIAINFVPSTLNLIAMAIFNWCQRIASHIDTEIASATNTFQEGLLKFVKSLNGILSSTAFSLFPNNRGELREHQYTGMIPYLTNDYIQEGVGGNVSTIIGDINDKIDAMNATGGSVCCVYQVPEELITGFDNSAVFQIEDTWFSPINKFFYINSVTPAYYTPKNNKLFTSPYTYMKVENKQGGEMNLAYEKIQDRHFKFWGSWQNGDVSVFMANDKYGTQGTVLGESRDLCRLQITNFPICNYNTNGLISKLANIASLMTKSLTNHLSQGMVAQGGQQTTREFGESYTQYQRRKAEIRQEETSNELRSQASNYIQELGQISNNIIGNVGHINSTPSSSGCDIANDNFGYAIHTMAITGEYAKIIDNFFEHFGYAVKLNKIPNVNTRPHWNYVKTSDCYITGNCPANDLAKIISIFNHGVTFWKVPAEVGNYSLNNH